MNFNRLFINSITTRSQLYNYQTVRWRRPRKPFWLGIAKSKMFVIPQPKIIRTREENAEVETLNGNYTTQYNSLMNFIQNENPLFKELVIVEGKTVKMDAGLSENISESLKVNESWNTESARRRDIRMKKSMEEEYEKAIREIDIHNEIEMKRMEVIEEIVKKEKVLSASFITPENLDEAIENCLNKVDCYDFAIDLEGNRYPGKQSLPSQLSTTDKQVPVESVG